MQEHGELHPPNWIAGVPLSLSQAQAVAMDQEVHDLLKKEVINLFSDLDGFFSPIFIVPKKDGGWRPIINIYELRP